MKSFADIEPSSVPRQLTREQSEFYHYLRQFVEENGRFPTHTEAKQAFGFNWDNSVTQRFKQLYGKGWIDRNGRGEWRFIRGTCPFCGQEIEGK